jgi:hypothetical protein
MDLIPEEIRARLLANGKERDRDHTPVVKLFCPFSAATWLLTELDPDDPEIGFGCCDLGFGCPELGSVSLTEIQSVRGPGGLAIERDLHFRPRFPLSVYAEAARRQGSIIEDTRFLTMIAAELGVVPVATDTAG